MVCGRRLYLLFNLNYLHCNGQTSLAARPKRRCSGKHGCGMPHDGGFIIKGLCLYWPCRPLFMLPPIICSFMPPRRPAFTPLGHGHSVNIPAQLSRRHRHKGQLEAASIRGSAQAHTHTPSHHAAVRAVGRAVGVVHVHSELKQPRGTPGPRGAQGKVKWANGGAQQGAAGGGPRHLRRRQRCRQGAPAVTGGAECSRCGVQAQLRAGS